MNLKSMVQDFCFPFCFDFSSKPVEVLLIQSAHCFGGFLAKPLNILIFLVFFHVRFWSYLFPEICKFFM